MTLTVRLPLFLLATVAALGAASSARAGGIQDDIQACGAAAVEAGLIPAEGYTLRYVKDKGSRNRVLTLKVVAEREGNEMIDCHMKRSKVVEVVVAKG